MLILKRPNKDKDNKNCLVAISRTQIAKISEVSGFWDMVDLKFFEEKNQDTEETPCDGIAIQLLNNDIIFAPHYSLEEIVGNLRGNIRTTRELAEKERKRVAPRKPVANVVPESIKPPKRIEISEKTFGSVLRGETEKTT